MPHSVVLIVISKTSRSVSGSQTPRFVKRVEGAARFVNAELFGLEHSKPVVGFNDFSTCARRRLRQMSSLGAVLRLRTAAFAR